LFVAAAVNVVSFCYYFALDGRFEDRVVNCIEVNWR